MTRVLVILMLYLVRHENFVIYTYNTEPRHNDKLVYNFNRVSTAETV